MIVNIRKCMISDSKRIHELCSEMLDFDYPDDKFEQNLRKLMGTPGNLVLVAENNQKLVGFAHATDYNVIYGDPMKYISAIAVDEPYRRYGVGEALLKEIDRWAVETGANGIRLYSGAERSAANAFYRAHSYELVKTEYQFKKDFFSGSGSSASSTITCTLPRCTVMV